MISMLFPAKSWLFRIRIPIAFFVGKKMITYKPRLPFVLTYHLDHIVLDKPCKKIST